MFYSSSEYVHLTQVLLMSFLIAQLENPLCSYVGQQLLQSHNICNLLTASLKEWWKISELS